jgi:hypothetical protein
MAGLWVFASIFGADWVFERALDCTKLNGYDFVIIAHENYTDFDKV